MYIARFTTENSNGQAAAADADTIRDALAQQIETAQAQLEASLDELQRAASTGQDAGLVQARAQLQGLARLQQRLGSASPTELAMVRAEVAASVAATQALAQQAPAFAASGQAREAALHAASHAAGHAVDAFVDDYFTKKKFEPFLRFASAEEEAEYRKREEARLKEITAARAEGTPEGNLRAALLSKEQLDDAKRYGAAQSPEFQTTYDRVDSAVENLEAQFSQNPAKASVTSRENRRADDDPMAALRAAGVAVADPSADGHGVSQNIKKSERGLV